MRMNERYSILQVLRSCNVTKSPRNDDLPILPILPERRPLDRRAGWPSTGMADESERGAKGESSTDIQAYHMSAQHPPLIRVSASPFTREPGSTEGLRKRRRRDPQGNGNRLVIKRVGNRSIRPCETNRDQSRLFTRSVIYRFAGLRA
jgi:hypothetical protein